MKTKTAILAIAFAATNAMAAPPTSLPENAIRGMGHIPFNKLPLNAVLVLAEHIPHGSPDPNSQIIYGTDNNDIIDVTDDIYYELVLVDPLDGNDIVFINRWQNVFTSPGDDTIIGDLSIGWGAPGYGAWGSPTPINVNLETGTAEDGFGYTDRLTNIRTVHLWGGTVIGTSADESVFSFSGGDKSLLMADGTDTIAYYQVPEENFSIEIVGTTVYVTHNDGSVDTIAGAEYLSFSDVTYEIVYP